MIHVFDNYYIKSDECQFVLCEKTNSVNKKTGETIYKALGYFPDISSSLVSLHKKLCRENVKMNDLELKEAIEMCDKIYKRIKEATNGY